MESEQTQVQVVPHNSGNLSMKQIADRVNIVHAVLEKVMVKGTHYGTVPGCGARMVLLKPGADVLAMTFRLVPQFAVTKSDLEHGHREFDVTCSMYGQDGTLLGQGVGSCSTMEKKYRYRWEGDGGNRHKVENEDIADVYNTVLKMAKKRAHVDATLTVTGAGDLFTQDLIDEDEPAKPPVAMPQERKTAKEAETAEGIVTRGVLEKISVKTGTGKKGPWTKYGLLVAGEWFGTFDADFGEAAKELEGKAVCLTWKQEGEFKTATGLVADTQPATNPN